MARRRHVPQRMCTGCGRSFNKEALVRFTVRSRGRERILVMDETGCARGRGAYVCRTGECFDRAMGKKKMQRRLNATSSDPLLEKNFIHMLENLR